jgi:spore germination protein KC
MYFVGKEGKKLNSKISRRSVWKTSVLILVLFTMTGCWDSLEIEQRAVVLGISIDKAEPDAEEEEEEVSHLKGAFPTPEQDMIRLAAQIAVPGRIPLGPAAGGGGDKDPVWMVSVVGHTIEDAMNNLQQEVADKVFLGHLRIIVLSEDIAREGVERFNDYLRRNPEIRRSAWMVVAKERAVEYMKIAPQLEQVPTLYLAAMVENAVGLGKFPDDFIGLFWARLSSKGQDAFLPYLVIKAEENIQLNGIAYFKGDQMVGVTSPMEIGFFMAVTGVEQGGYSAFVKIPDTEETVLVRAQHRHTRIKTRIKDGKPHVTVHIHYESEIDEKNSAEINLNDSSMITAIEKEASKGVIESVEKFITKTQEEPSDIFGFGEYIRAKHPSFWNSKIKSKENWREWYKDLVIDVQCTSDIRRVGMKAK